MSFSSEQKEQIINGTYKSKCCRRALLLGLLFARGRISDNEIFLSVDREVTAEFACGLIREFYSTDAQRVKSSSGGRRVVISFKSDSALKFISNIDNSDDIVIEKCQNCRPSFLKGVFLGSGRVSDPAKSYTLEFSLDERSEKFYAYLSSLGMNAGILMKEKSAVYFRSSAGMEEFFANAGMNTAMFSVIEARFNGEAKLNIHRVTNCYTNNIAKTVDAAAEQLKIIKALESANLLSSLPDELEQTARLRLQNPDLSLSQLSAISVPKVSKPGLSHRLKKIIEIGRSLLEKK